MFTAKKQPLTITNLRCGIFRGNQFIFLTTLILSCSTYKGVYRNHEGTELLFITEEYGQYTGSIITKDTSVLYSDYYSEEDVLYSDSLGKLVIDGRDNCKDLGVDSLLILIKQRGNLIDQKSKVVRYYKSSAKEVGLYVSNSGDYKEALIFSGDVLTTLFLGGEGCGGCVASETGYYLESSIGDTLIYKPKEVSNSRQLKVLKGIKRLTIIKHSMEVLNFKLSTRI